MLAGVKAGQVQAYACSKRVGFWFLKQTPHRVGLGSTMFISRSGSSLAKYQCVCTKKSKRCKKEKQIHHLFCISQCFLGLSRHLTSLQSAQMQFYYFPVRTLEVVEQFLWSSHGVQIASLTDLGLCPLANSWHKQTSPVEVNMKLFP